MSKRTRNAFSPSLASTAHGFTLIELLVVIAIIAILAAMLLPALARAKKKAQQANCVSNFKQMGLALRMYTDDSQEQLPPGAVAAGATPVDALSQTQSPVYSGTTATSNYKKLLVYYLAPFMSQPGPEAMLNKTNVVQAFLCPGYKSTFPGNSCNNMGYNPDSDGYEHAYSYSVTRSTNQPIGTLSGLPFGKQNDANQRPMKLTAILQPADIWAVADLDCDAVQNPSGLGSVYTSGYVATHPVHSSARNFLYFDFHVASKKVTTYADY